MGYTDIHIADNDQASCDHLPLGKGSIDWENFFVDLKRHRYSGYIGLDLSGGNTMAADLRACWEYITRQAEQLDLVVER